MFLFLFTLSSAKFLVYTISFIVLVVNRLVVSIASLYLVTGLEMAIIIKNHFVVVRAKESSGFMYYF